MLTWLLGVKEGVIFFIFFIFLHRSKGGREGRGERVCWGRFKGYNSMATGANRFRQMFM